MHKLVYSSLISLMLSACGTLEVSVYQTPTPDASGTETAQAFPPESMATASPDLFQQPLSMESSSDYIREKIGNSANTWKNIWVTGMLPDVNSRQEFWFDHSGMRFRFLGGSSDGKVQKLKVSDGNSILEMDVPTGQTQTQAMPSIEGQVFPTSSPGEAINIAPSLQSVIGEQLSGLALSSDWASSGGIYKPVALETTAGRQTLEAEWRAYGENRLPSWRVWLDVQTGVILKLQTFDKMGGDQVRSESVVTQVQYDVPNLPDNLFSVTPTALPFFSDAWGNPLTTVTPAPTVQTGADPLGDVYFQILSHEDDPSTSRLVRLPGSCVAGKTACPQPEKIALPEYTAVTNDSTFAWSANGKMVAFAPNRSAAGGKSGLYVAQVSTTPSWVQVAQFPCLDIPTWSPDGHWISFRGADCQDKLDYYVVHPDGTGLLNVTATDKLPVGGRPYIAGPWVADQLIVYSGIPSQENPVYLLSVENGQIKPLLKTPKNKVSYLSSPDGSLLAFAMDGVLRIFPLDGSGPRDLATFTMSMTPQAWSPDGKSLIFNVYGDGEAAPPSFSIYVINLDGRGLKQVYSGTAFSSVSFSPDGHFLLIGSGMPSHIAVVDLNSLESQIIQAPGLDLTDLWIQPAWVP